MVQGPILQVGKSGYLDFIEGERDGGVALIDITPFFVPVGADTVFVEVLYDRIDAVINRHKAVTHDTQHRMLFPRSPDFRIEFLEIKQMDSLSHPDQVDLLVLEFGSSGGLH